MTLCWPLIGQCWPQAGLWLADADPGCDPWTQCTTEIWETPMSTDRNKHGVSRYVQGKVSFGPNKAGKNFVALSAIYDSAHPTYLGTIYVLTDVPQMWVAMARWQPQVPQPGQQRLSSSLSGKWCHNTDKRSLRWTIPFSKYYYYFPLPTLLPPISPDSAPNCELLKD